MKNDREDPASENAGLMRTMSLAMGIPMLLLAGPVVGFFLGRWLAGFVGQAKAGSLIGLIVGFVVGIRETIRLIRRIVAESK